MLMSEFVCMEDWDLQAVVRGCSRTEAFAIANIMNNHPPSSSPSLLAPLSFDDDQDHDIDLSAFPETITAGFDGLEGLYKPFYPVFHQTLSPQTILPTTTSISIPTKVKDDPPKLPKNQAPQEESNASATSTDATQAIKSKRRKNQHKRVVKQVTEDGLSFDMWAWRKYGQKPIKGSPYPRSYYRCSSLKGCLARKQVERSSSDPSIFIVTYTAEHSHAHPTRRNSLAGSTRIKSSLRREFPANNEPNKPTIKEKLAYSPNLDTVPSATTPSITASIEDEVVQQVSIKNEEEEERILDDIVFSDELFPSLEDIEVLLLDKFADTTVPCSLMKPQF